MGWILESKVTPFSSKKTLNISGKLYSLNTPLVMGILNVTPDSFYHGSRFNTIKDLKRRVKEMIDEGADIIDIGGYSSRPGADHIPVNEEISRVIPAIQEARLVSSEIPLSIDTFRVEVANAALNAGADMVNDITGGSNDPEMVKMIADRQVPYVLMHMRGNPQTMSSKTNYQDVVGEVMGYFVERIEQMVSLGVKDIMVDPGFGFAKTIDQNYVLLNNLGYFQELNIPILVGLSRKSMIYKPLQVTANESLIGTCVLNTIALMNGASILRVHDIEAAQQAISLYKNTFP